MAVDFAAEVAGLNETYLKYHVAKEDVFWTTYMGVNPDQARFDEAERSYKAYISDPANLKRVRALHEALGDGQHPSRQAIEGWLHFFQAHVVEDSGARAMQDELIALEGELFQKRAKYTLHYENEQGEETPGSSVVMATNIRTSDNEKVRRTSHKALLDLERWVLDNGFIEMVKKRNAYARAQGYTDYFAYSVQKNEHINEAELFEVLDAFEELTRDRCMNFLKELAAEKGSDALEPYNLQFAVKGDTEAKVDPYLPFSKSLRRWVESFSRLGIGYRGATLSLDLIDRKGKYENGFMHGPMPCFFKDGQWNPARINFTSNATPNQVGSGRRGLETLFHEGGHAAHFSNITMDAPCFSQEFAPTSMAYAETQSMFLDSLCNDADWLMTYAETASGDSIPEELVREVVTSEQPYAAFAERQLLLVGVFEHRLYSMDEAKLTPEAIIALARSCEQEILGVKCSPRPLLSVPHLLSDDSACAYHGYLLANMAVFQTRAHFMEKYGYLTDNHAIGPALEKYYWSKGNAVSHRDTVRNLTGKPFSPAYLADYCNLDKEGLWQLKKAQIEDMRNRTASLRKPNLNANIRIVHGDQVIADNSDSLEAMCDAFERWIETNWPTN